jgi:hypothetical protein
VSEAAEDPGASAPTDDWLTRLHAATRAPALGQLGPYRVLSTRRGGQGLVLQAIQPGTERVVALKRVGDGALSGDGALRRFEREAELLVELEHPNIVRVYGLELIDHVPLLVMEWVDGPDLAAWARGGADGPRSVAQRLELFVALCDAVHFAHQRGVIHRDIKPSNVIVGADGRPRLLDFGLARRSAANSDETLTIGFLGTPEFSPPEAFAGGAAALDARGDVWSLGVVLYELLTDRRPFRGDSLAELAEAVTSSEPEQPSRVRCRLGRDLDAIVMQALEKSQGRRYGSAAHFADDLRRFLAGEPVAARPQRVGYVLGRWIRRRRLVSSLLALCLLLLVGGVAYGSLQARRLVIERDRVALGQQRTAEALADSEDARRAAEVAQAASEKLLDMAKGKTDEAQRIQAFYMHYLFAPLVSGRDEDRDRGLELARTLAADAPAFFSAYPNLAAEILSKVSNSLGRIGFTDEAEAMATQGIDLLAGQELTSHGILADLLTVRGVCALRRESWDDARRDFEQAALRFAEMGRPSTRPGGYAAVAVQLAQVEVAANRPAAASAWCDLAQELLAEAKEDLPIYRDLAIAIPCARLEASLTVDDVEAAQEWLRVARQRRDLQQAPSPISMARLEICDSLIQARRGEWALAAERMHLALDGLSSYLASAVNVAASYAFGIAARAAEAGSLEVALGLYDRMSAAPFEARVIERANTAASALRAAGN